MANANETEEFEDSPIEQVRLTVSTSDDPALPSFTFRVLVLGLSSCILLGGVDSFLAYRQSPAYLSTQLVQLISLPLGKLMATTLPTKSIRVPGIGWQFSLNPGPFNIKEHALITVMSYGSSSNGNAEQIISSTKAFYHKPLNPYATLMLFLTTRLMGYGFGGIFMKLLVDSAYMWWPLVVADVSFYRALHEKETRSKGELKRVQFFILVFISSFAYSIIPNYLFPSITALSFVCWIWKDSVRAQQLGSGLNGFGMGAISVDWSTPAAYMGSPLTYPTFALVTSLVGYVLVVYIITPLAYWNDEFNAKRFPLFATDIFDDRGQPYNVTRIMKDEPFEFDQNRNGNYSKPYLGAVNAYSYGFGFAALASAFSQIALASAFSQIALFHGKSIWTQLKQAYQKKYSNNIHNKLMEAYPPIPEWWYLTILVSTIVLAILTCEGFGKQFQLPYWGVILAAGLVFTAMPLNAISATTGQTIDTAALADLSMGYLRPGRPLLIAAFNSYAGADSTSMMCMMNLKLGYYLKIPPRSMFLAQVISATLGTSVAFVVTWWLFSSVENICHPELLPKGSPWTCPRAGLANTGLTLSGIIGPARAFFPYGVYSKLYLFYIVGALAPLPVWFLSLKFPEYKWIKLINMPSIFIGATRAPLVTPVRFWSWFAIGITFNFVIYRMYKLWWARYTYILSIGLDAGIAVMSLLLAVSLQANGILGVEWWGLELDDHCPLANCPSAPGIEVRGCPVFH